MRNIIAFIIAVICVFSLSNPASAQIKGAAMGGLTTVVSDGAFDAARNPALLAFQKSTHSFAAFGKYRPYYSSDFELANNSVSLKRGEPETLTFGGVAAYTYAAGSTVFGFAMGELGGDLYNSSKVDSIIYTPGGELRSTEETQELTPSLAMSLAFPIGDSSFIGFQVSTTYYTKKTSVTEKLYASGLAQILDKEKSLTALSAGVGFGYLYSTPDSQAGILIRTGNAELYYEDMKIKFNDITDVVGAPPLIDYSNSVSSKKRIRYSDPASISVGGYKRFTPLFACAFESVYTLVSAYPSKTLDDVENVSDSDDIDIKLIKSYSKTREKIEVKGGAEFNVLPQLAFTLGAGYSYAEMSSSTGSNDAGSTRSRTQLEILYSTLGAHYAINEKTSLSFIVFFAKVNGSFDIEDNNFSISADAPMMFVDTGIGVTTKF